MLNYIDFLKTKKHIVGSVGRDIPMEDIHPRLFVWQKQITQWAMKKGRCAIFLDTGLGKTLCQTEFARLLGENTLIIAPLSVARQTVRMARDMVDLDVRYVRGQDQVNGNHKLWITNYDMIDSFDPAKFGAVVLDESSIIKGMGSKTRVKLINMFKNTPYRLCCTATPAPNDYIELGNHAEFLGICKMSEMLATFFINANKEHTRYFGDLTYRKKGSNVNGTEWRLKHHAEKHFFEWLASWVITMTKPSDLSYDDNGFILPPLNITPIFVRGEYKPTDQLFFTHLHGISDRVKVRNGTLESKLDILKEVVSRDNGQWIIWCGLDRESAAAKEVLGDDAVEVKGSDSIDYKVEALEAFQDGKHRILISKSKIAGYGMNFQNANNAVFLGMSDSFESFYQSIRREWRYGQTKPVNVYPILHEVEAEVYENVMRKERAATRLKKELIAQIKDYEKGELGLNVRIETDYRKDTVTGNGWTAMLGDSCERIKEIPDNSVDLSVYSPPFADLFTYTASERDLGNSRDWAEFFEHYAFIIREILRVTKVGRLTCVHTSDIPAMAQKDGYIGLRDFPGEVIRAYEREGWIFTGRCFVPKSPQAQAIRIHSKALAFGQLRKDSTDIRPALVDQVLLLKKPGENEVPVTPVANGEMDNETWIIWANGVWSGIRETETLQYARARGVEDEKHVAPLQLETVERCIKMYSNPKETVLSPFMGIGTECYQAVKFGRKAIGIELKSEYFKIACENLKEAEVSKKDMFSQSGMAV